MRVEKIKKQRVNLFLVVLLFGSLFFVSAFEFVSGEIPEFSYSGEIEGLGFKEAPAHPFIVDWNDDGKKDLTYFSDNGRLFLYLNEGSNSNPLFDGMDCIYSSNGCMISDYNGRVNFDKVFAFSTGEPWGRAVHQVLDYDGDGKKDVVFGTMEDGSPSPSSLDPPGIRGFIFIWKNSGTNEKPIFDSLSSDTGGKTVSQEYGLSYDIGRYRPLLGGDVSLVETENGNFINTDSYYGGMSPYFVDWDGDGDVDLLLGASGYANQQKTEFGRIRYYENIASSGEPVFSDSPVYLASNGKELKGAHPVVYDLDKDGNLELILVREDGAWVYEKNSDFDLNSGKKVISFKVVSKSSLIPRVVASDWNEDGFVDLVQGDEDFGGNANQAVFVYYGLDSSGLNFDNRISVKSSEFISKDALLFDVFDYDFDGDKDLVAGAKRSLNHEFYFYFYENTRTNSNPQFTEKTPLSFTTGSANSLAPYFVDFDSDGDFDVFYTGGRKSLYYLRNDAGSYNEFNLVVPEDNSHYWGGFGKINCGSGDCSAQYGLFPNVIDWDGDGKKDILGSWDKWATNTHSIIFMKNTGTDENPFFDFEVNNFEILDKTFFGSGRGVEPYSYVIDLNQDGLLDLVTVDFNSNLKYYENTAFSRNEKPVLANGVSLHASGRDFAEDLSHYDYGPTTESMFAPVLEFVDWNEDGYLDVVQTDGFGDLHLYLGSNMEMKNCSQLGGEDCALGMVCEGNVLMEAKDTDRCCYSRCYAPVELENCSAQGGTNCEQDEECVDGNFIAASDSSRCCSGVCEVVEVPVEGCVLENAYWSELEIEKGDSVEAFIEGVNCFEKEIDFEIKEKISLLGIDWLWPDKSVFSESGASIEWVANSIGEFYFIASLGDEEIDSRDFGDNLIVSAVCGDGVKEGGEDCDDGNLVDGDGCSSCVVDFNWECEEVDETSVCERVSLGGPEIILSASNEIERGDSFEVYVNVSGVEDLYGYVFDVEFDSNKLQFLDAEYLDFLGSSVYEIDYGVSSGVVGDFASTRLQDSSGVEGEGGLVKLKFRALDSGGSFVKVVNGEFYDSDVGLMDVEVRDLQIQISFAESGGGQRVFEDKEISFFEGKNSFSLPLVLDDMSVEGVFGEVIGKVEKIYGYDSVDGEWKVYYPDGRPSNLEELKVGVGYFVVAKEGFNLNLRGSKRKADNSRPEIVLRPGWNYIGAFSNTKEAREVLAGVDYSKLYVFDRSLRGYVEVSENTVLDEKLGYWVFVEGNQQKIIVIGNVVLEVGDE